VVDQNNIQNLNMLNCLVKLLADKNDDLNLGILII